jgi:hypothetical protein
MEGRTDSEANLTCKTRCVAADGTLRAVSFSEVFWSSAEWIGGSQILTKSGEV